MATGKAVGEISDLIKLLDEFQYEVPKKYIQIKCFETKEEAQAYKFEGKIQAGKPKFINGKWCAIYSPVGELAVKCIEQAARVMGSPVHITGEYLCGRNWADTH